MTTATANPHLPYGIVEIAPRTFYIVQGGQLGSAPMWFRVESEPKLTSLAKAIRRCNELNGR